MFLVASPILPDPNFTRAVVLLCEHSDEGSMGLVVNRPSPVDLIESMADLQPHPGQLLWIGGPVQRDIAIVLHRDAGIRGARPIADGMALGGDEEELLELVRGPRHRAARVFAGYAGWGAGQLQEEMQTRSWIACPASAHFVFDVAPEEVWAAVVHSLGPRYAYLTQIPGNPRVN
jgi:putative transcriptional regulator